MHGKKAVKWIASVLLLTLAMAAIIPGTGAAPPAQEPESVACGDYIVCSTASDAVYVRNTGAGAVIYGHNTSTGFGLKGRGNPGVYGFSYHGAGIRGKSRTNMGVKAESDSGNAVEANSTYGVGVLAISTNHHGIYGQTLSTSSSYASVLGLSPSAAAGVSGQSATGWGVKGWSNGTTSAGCGIMGENVNAAGTGVWGRAPSYGVVGDSTSGSNYAGYFYDNIYVGGSCIGCKLGYIAQNDSPQPLQVGDTISISGIAAPLAGQSMPVLKVQKATNQTSAAGVVQMRGVKQASPDGEGTALQASEGSILPGDYLFIVVQGLVQVRADAAAGIQAGDWLMADGQGLAALAEPDASTIGQAVDAVDPATGLVWVLVDLQ